MTPRIIFWGLLLTAVISLLGCASGAPTSSSASTQPPQETTTLSPTTSSPMTSSTVAPSVSGAESTSIKLDLGLADTIKLGEAWLRIAEAGGFNADAASPDTLELNFSHSGSLVHLLIVARTDAGEAVTVSWDGLQGQPDQRVVAKGDVVHTVATLPRRSDRVAPFLAALDEAGPTTIFAQLQPDRPGAYYDVMPIFSRFDSAGGIPAEIPALMWDGSAFAPLPKNDSRRGDHRDHVRFRVYAEVPESLPSQAGGGSTGTTISWNIRDFAYFVIPVPQGPTSTSTETTLAASPGGLLVLEEADLASASMFVHSSSYSAPGSGFAEFPIDLTDAAKRTSLVALLNGLKKLDQMGNPTLFPVELRVTLRDRQELSVIWYEHQPLALMSVTNSLDHEARGAVVESSELSAFLAAYLQYRK